MNDEISIIRQSSLELLSKSKGLIGITNRILPNNSLALSDLHLKSPYVSLGHTADVRSIAFHPNGKIFLSGSEDQTLKLWDLESGKVIRTFAGHKNGVVSVAFSPDGKTIVSGDYEGASSNSDLKVWNTLTGNTLHNLQGHLKAIRSIAFSPDGKSILSGSEDRTLKLWDVKSGKIIRTFKGHAGSVYSIAFSPDGKSILSGSEDQSIKLWDVESGKVIRTFELHAGSVYSIAFSPDGMSAVSGGEDQTLKLWNINTGCIIRTFDVGEDWIWMYPIAFSPDGKIISSLTSGFLEEELRIFDVSTGALLHTVEGDFKSVSFDPDSKFILVGCRNGTIKLFDHIVFNEIKTFSNHMKRNMSLIKFFTDENTIFDLAANLYLWDITTGQRFYSSEEITNDTISTIIEFDTKKVISGDLHGSMNICNLETGEEIFTCDTTGSLRSPLYSPDSKLLILESDEYGISYCDTTTNESVRRLEGHTNKVEIVAFSADSKRLLSRGFDGSLKLWDLLTGKEIQTMISFKDGEWITITPDGYFNLSQNARQYLAIETSSLSAGEINDEIFQYYYRPTGLRNSTISTSLKPN